MHRVDSDIKGMLEFDVGFALLYFTLRRLCLWREASKRPTTGLLYSTAIVRICDGICIIGSTVNLVAVFQLLDT
jgi:hypothetical protein